MTGGGSVSGKDTTSGRGQQAEALAARFLERNGLRVLARNFRCRGGEIDLVCGDGRTLVFVEVRLRCHRAYGGAVASITRSKQQRVILAARHYLAANAAAERPCRFDCVLLDDLSDAGIEWVRDAFAAD